MSLKLTSLAALALAAGPLMSEEPTNIIGGKKDAVAGILQNDNKLNQKAEKSARIMSERGSDHRNWLAYSGETKIKHIFRERKPKDTEEATGNEIGVKIEFRGKERVPGVVVFRCKLAPGSYNLTFSEGNIDNVGFCLTDKRGNIINENGDADRVGMKRGPEFTLKIPENSGGDCTLFLHKPDSINLQGDPDSENKLFFKELKVVPVTDIK